MTGRFLRRYLAVAALTVLLVLFGLSLFAGAFAPEGFSAEYSRPPSLAHPMGTDALGHDLFSQVLGGVRNTVQVAVLVTAISVVVGVAVGVVAGYYRGWIDGVLGRVIDLMLAVPFLVVLLVVANRVRADRANWVLVALVISLLTWPWIARIIRGAVLELRERPFVEAARALGARDTRIIWHHLLPAAAGSVVTVMTLTFLWAVLAEAALAFLSFGPDVSLGRLVEEGQHASNTRPWLFYFPGVVLLLICLCVNFVGDGLHAALSGPDERSEPISLLS